MGSASEGAVSAHPVGRRRRRVVVVLLGATIVSSWIADLMLGRLIIEHPLVLLAMSDRLRNVTIVSSELGLAEYLLVGGPRLIGPHVLYYFVGRWYGASLVGRVEGRWEPAGRLVARVESVYVRFRYPLTAFVPFNFGSILAGSSGMSPTAFLVTRISGTLVVMIGMRVAADQLSSLLAEVTEWIDGHALLVFVAVALVIVASGLRRLVTGRGGPLDLGMVTIEEVASEPEDDEASDRVDA